MLLPWGALLEGIVRARAEIVDGIAAARRAGSGRERDAQRRDLARLHAGALRGPAASRRPDTSPRRSSPSSAGRESTSDAARYLTAAEAKALPTTWARRLGHGRPHPQFRLHRTVCAETRDRCDRCARLRTALPIPRRPRAAHQCHSDVARGGAVGGGEARVERALKAALLGIVEGITEFLPISSTGHLVVTQKLIHVGTHPGTKDAADTYAITIQSGAILAVIVLYWHRLKEMALGVVGRDPEGRQIVNGHVRRVHSRGHRRRRAGKGDTRPALRRVADHRRLGGRRRRDPVVRAEVAPTGRAIGAPARGDHRARRGDDRLRASARVVAGNEPQPGHDPRRPWSWATAWLRPSSSASCSGSLTLGAATAFDLLAARQGAVRRVRIPESVHRLPVRVRLGRHRRPLDGDVPAPPRARDLRLVPLVHRGRRARVVDHERESTSTATRRPGPSRRC